ncbi:MAG: hypothetical protein A2020_16485 [Lentisphaerae bacterium GWF2_45_14]|nr:MAG: hypothetical protein A2020_16485 [Lentisphaerae bacterium GWF2_45_14]
MDAENYSFYKGKIIGGLNALRFADDRPGMKEAIREIQASFTAMAEELETETDEEETEEEKQEETAKEPKEKPNLDPDFLTADFYKDCKSVNEAILLFCQSGNYSENAVRQACGLAAETWRKIMKGGAVYHASMDKIYNVTGIPQSFFTITQPYGAAAWKKKSNEPIDKDNGDWIAERKALNAIR